jgi:hypothetical protein
VVCENTSKTEGVIEKLNKVMGGEFAWGEGVSVFAYKVIKVTTGQKLP